MIDELSEAHLLDRYREGHSDAFASLVKRHQGALLRYARALLGAVHSAEDIVQEAFLRLAEKPPVLPPEVVGDARRERAALASWMHKVTRNLCMDLQRSERRRRHRESAVAPDEAAEGGLAGVEASDTTSAVKRSLQRLPLDQREVLVLRLLGEKSYREIAQITGKKVGTVGWLVSVGLKALATELAPLIGGLPGEGSRRSGFSPARGEL